LLLNFKKVIVGMKTMTFFDDLSMYKREKILAQGFWALQIYRFGHIRYKFSSKLIRYPLGVVHILLNKISEILFGITIGVEAKIGKRLVIEHFGAIVIHGKTVIGDDCIIRQGVTIGNKTMNKPHDAPTLGNNVNVGAGAKILGKVIIGNNVDIGANAVVINDVPDNYIAVGVPAKLIKK
jgi:serine O-acetyltransferase